MRKVLKSEKTVGMIASADTMEIKMNVAEIVVNFPCITMVSITHFKSIKKKANPKKKPQIAALDKAFSRSMATRRGINASQARRSISHGGNASDNSRPLVRDRIKDSIMLMVRLVLDRQAFGMIFPV